MKITETEIPCPWGRIAAKIWGDQTDPIVLSVHGIMDNAGSFDRLIPLLPPGFCYICIDLPGHGKSTHMPPFFPIYSVDYVLVYKYLIEHYKKEKYIIMGHSYGGHLGLAFAQLYPENVEKLILLDAIHLYPIHVNRWQNDLRRKFDHCISLEKEKLHTKTYTYEEAIKKLREERLGFITREAAKALLPRGIIPTAENGKFRFAVDPRMRAVMNPIHDLRYMVETLKKLPVTCPVLMILGRQAQSQQMVLKHVLDALKKDRNFRIKYVEGPHDVHNNKPEIVGPLVSKFLVRQRAKL